MGQGYSKEHSSSAYGSLYVQTEQPFYFSGQLVRGNIHLNLHEPYPARFIDLQVKGKEKASFKEYIQVRDHDGEFRTKEVKRKDDKKIFYTRLPIANFNGMVPAGMWTYPFQFYLTNDLPSSVIIAHHRFKAKVNYSVKAIMEPMKDSDVKKMKYKQRLIIRQQSVGVEYGQMREETGEVVSCCCYGKGQASVRGSFQKNFYTPDETAKAAAWVDNTRCKVPVSRLALQLRMIVELEADHHHYTHSNVVAEHDYEGVPVGGTTGDDPRHLDLDMKTIKMEVKPRKKKDWSAQDKFLAEMSPANCSAKLVKVRYVLEVNPKYDDIICCSSSPRVSLEMFLLPPQLPSFGQVQTPDVWEPEVQPTYQFSIQDQPFVPQGQLPPYYQEGAPMPQPMMQNMPVAQPYGAPPPPGGYPAPAMPMGQPVVEMNASVRPLAEAEDNETC